MTDDTTDDTTDDMTDDTTGPDGRDEEPPRAVRSRVFSHGGPAPAPVCPLCDHSGAHHRGCELAVLSVEEAALLGYEEALRRARSLVAERGAPVTGAPPPVAQCPSCHHSGTHLPRCELAVLPVEDAALLGYEEACHRVRLLVEGAVSWGAPPPAPQCPGCHHSGDHGPGCDLAALPVGDAALLGYQAALRRVRHLGEPATRSGGAPRRPEAERGDAGPVSSGPVDSGPVDSGPVNPGEPVCPACFRTDRHRSGCELEALPVVATALLGHENARARLRTHPGTTGPASGMAGPEAPAPETPVPETPAPPPSGGIRARLRRLLRR